MRAVTTAQAGPRRGGATTRALAQVNSTSITELLRQVMGSLLRNKLRSFLTMAGIAWGIASIVLIVAMGDGFKEGQRNNTKSLGENIVILFGGRTQMQAGGERAVPPATSWPDAQTAATSPVPGSARR